MTKRLSRASALADAAKTEVKTEQTELTESPLPWEELTWSGLPMWRCRQCPWDTLEGEAAMIEHIEARHGTVAEPPQRRLVQAFDVWGNPRP